MSATIVWMLVAPCLVSAALAGLVGLRPGLRWLEPRRLGWLLALGPVVVFATLLSVSNQVVPHGAISASIPWMPSLGMSLGLYLDGLSLLFGLLIAGIATLATIYGGYYFDGNRTSWLFQLYLLLFTFFMLGIVLAGDLILLFMCWEGTSITSFLLIGYKTSSKASQVGALRSLLITGGGGIALLAGLLILGFLAGSLNLPAVLGAGDTVRASHLYGLALALIALGAFTKSAQFPFHSWLPGGMTAPTPASALLHSATMVKAGVYLLARLNPTLGFTESWFWLLTGVGGLTMFVGAYVGLMQRDLKGLLAYSTIAQLGVLVMLIGQNTAIAFKALAVGIVAHALYKSALFLLVGIVDHAAHTRDLDKLGGLRRVMPWTMGLMIVGAASMAGLPPLFGFLAKETLLATTVHPSAPAWVSWSLSVAAVAAGAFLLAQSGVVILDTFFGEPHDKHLVEHAHDPSWGMLLGPAIPVVLTLAVIVMEPLGLASFFAAAAEASYGEKVKVSLALWHGFNLPLALSGIAIALGLALLAYRETVRRWQIAQSPGPIGDGLYEGVLRLVDGAAWLATRLQNGMIRWYLTVMLIGIGVLLIVARALHWPTSLGEPWPMTEQNVMTAVALTWTVIGAGATIALKRDLYAILAYGAAGLGVSLTFLLHPAPDVALVMLVVEVLTVVVLVLALLRLPSAQQKEADLLDFREKTGDLVRDTALAVCAGGVIAVAALGLTSTHPRDSRIAPYVLANAKPDVSAADTVGAIIVDYRALDTLIEISVFSLACIGGLTLSRWASRTAGDPAPETQEHFGTTTWSRVRQTPLVQLLAMVVLPFSLVLASTHVMFGHNQPGDGFTAGVIVTLAVGFWLLVMGHDRGPFALPWLRPVGLVSAGLVVAVVAAGIGWFTQGTFFAHVNMGKQLGLPLPQHFSLSTSWLFELSIFLVVLGSGTLLFNVLSPSSDRPMRVIDGLDRIPIDPEETH